MKLLAILAVIACCAATGLACGSVRDGEAKIVDSLSLPGKKTVGSVDLADAQIQHSTTSFSANWNDFTLEGERVILYEWSIISHDMVMALPADQRTCVKHLNGLPDVFTWNTVDLKTSATARGLNLVAGKVYHAAVRATFSNGDMSSVAISDGLVVVEKQEVSKPQHQKRRNIEKRQSTTVGTAIGNVIASCPIDQANRCRQSQEKVGDQLNVIYGPPEWRTALLPFRQPEETYAALRKFTGFVDPDKSTATVRPRNYEELKAAIDAGLLIPYVDNHHDDDSSEFSDDDDGTPAWVAAILIPLILILLLALLLILLAFFLWRHLQSSDDDYGPAETGEAAAYPGVMAADDEETSYRQGRGALTTEASDRTRVEFPDTAIRRLSITHQDDVPDAAEDDDHKSPRRKHPIMQSASSSFRDYRNVNVS